jgi:hypothetical protein
MLPLQCQLASLTLCLCLRVFVCVCVCVNQRLKDVASSNPLYSDGYVKLRTDLRAHAVIDREEKRIERGTFYMCCAVFVMLNACKPCDSGAGKKKSLSRDTNTCSCDDKLKRVIRLAKLKHNLRQTKH